MSDEQKKSDKPKIGSISQYASIGGKKERTEDMQATVTQKRQDVKTSEEMERQTVWMPHRLRTRLKVYAALHQDDISGIITRLVETFLNDADRGQE